MSDVIEAGVKYGITPALCVLVGANSGRITINLKFFVMRRRRFFKRRFRPSRRRSSRYYKVPYRGIRLS